MTTGIPENKVDIPAVTIFSPNQENGNYHLLFGKSDSYVNISVYNTNGQLIEFRNLNSIIMGHEEIIDLSKFQSGIYIIKIKGNNIQKIKKIVR